MWAEELRQMLLEADGDLGLFVALAALRRTENGAPGREFGVLSVPAPTFAQQLHVARMSLMKAELRQKNNGSTHTRGDFGLFTDDFYKIFSSRWAPTTGASNDPTGLNSNHAKNLIAFAHQYGQLLLSLIYGLPGPLSDATEVA